MSTWDLPSRWTISVGDQLFDEDAPYHAGRLEDVLILSSPFIVLAAGPTSGVWSLNASGGPTLNWGYDWEVPNMTSLARGIHGDNHVFAGGDVALYETDTTHAFPLANWRRIPLENGSFPVDAGVVLDILVLKGNNTPVVGKPAIVLACGKGIIWSTIPDPGGVYNFQFATAPNIGYYGITEGPNNSVVAAAWGSGDKELSGIFHGKFHRGVGRHNNSRGLDLTKTTAYGKFGPDTIFPNVDLQSMNMYRTSLDSCEANRNIIYAVAGYEASKQNKIYSIIKSTDGGITWNPTGMKVDNRPGKHLFAGKDDPDLAGNQQGYNNCIAVSPLDPNRVVVGWRNGYFYSTNGGTSWTMIDQGASEHLHGDFHAVAFDPADSTQRTLYICSDGGIAVTTDLGKSHTSKHNRQLPNLQIRTITVSYMNPGLIAASLQDNGDIYNYLYSQTPVWKSLEGESDGRSVRFIRNGRLLYYNNTEQDPTTKIEFGAKVRDARWDTTSEKFKNMQWFFSYPLDQGVIPLDGTTRPGSLDSPTDGLQLIDPQDGTHEPIEIVNNPLYKNGRGESMVAIAGVGVKLHGLFLLVDSDWQTNPVHWTFLGKFDPKTKDSKGNLFDSDGLPYEKISAVGSSDGKRVYVGTNAGRILEFNASSWTSIDLTPSGSNNMIYRFVIQSDTLAFAISNSAQLFKMRRAEWLARVWEEIPGPPDVKAKNQGYTAMATDWTVSPKTLFLSTDNAVYSSSDEGKSWSTISGVDNGLPRVPHCTDLAFIKENSGSKFLYVSTYGWSVFRLLLNPIPEGPKRSLKLEGEMGIEDEQIGPNSRVSHTFSQETRNFDQLNPADVVSISGDGGSEIEVPVTFWFAWHVDQSVEIKWNAKLVAKDENNFVDDEKSGAFSLKPEESRGWNIFLQSGEFYNDLVNVNVKITY